MSLEELNKMLFEEYMGNNKKRETAEKLNISRIALYNWIKQGIPLKKLKEVSILTGISIVSLLIESYSKKYGNKNLN